MRTTLCHHFLASYRLNIDECGAFLLQTAFNIIVIIIFFIFIIISPETHKLTQLYLYLIFKKEKKGKSKPLNLGTCKFKGGKRFAHYILSQAPLTRHKHEISLIVDTVFYYTFVKI